MRIVVDMQSCQSSFSGTRGVGRYTDNLIRALLRNPRGHKIFLAVNGAFEQSIEIIRNKYNAFIPQDQIIVCQNHLRTQFSLDREIEKPKQEISKIAEIIWEEFLNTVNPDVIFSPNLQEGFSDPSITSVHQIQSNALYATTLHDLTPYHFRKELLSDSIVSEWYEEKVSQAIKSDIIITVSHSTKKDINKFLEIPMSDIHDIHSGYDNEIFKFEESRSGLHEILDKYEIPKEFIFYFGGGDICKNIPRLIEAYGLLDDSIKNRFKLVLGGKSFKHDPYGNSHNEVRILIEELGLVDFIITPGFITDDDLPVLLQACSCFVFPSTHEGFGLPALEAMACGAPVIGANQSSVAEVIGNEEALFDPYDSSAISKKISAILKDHNFSNRVRKAGLERAKHFAWSKTADDLLDVFEEAIKHRPKARRSYRTDALRHTMNSIKPFTPALNDDELSDLSRMLDETFKPGGRKTIYIDVSTVANFDDRTGIQRVTRAISLEMLTRPPADFDVELVHSSTEENAFYSANNYKNSEFGINSGCSDDYIIFNPGDILLYLDQAPRMAINHKNYIRHLRNIGVRVYFYIHDLIPLLHPEWFSEGGVDEFRELMETVATADGALCCSRVTADHLQNYVSDRLENGHRIFQIGYAHHGADLQNSSPTLGLPEGSRDLLNKITDRPSFLMVGTIEPRKGHKQTLSAFEELWKNGLDINLIIVGRWGWGMDSFDDQLLLHSEIGKRLFWLKNISDEYLLKIYENVDCLIAASEAEGFGLPLIEAARHGIPIVARDIKIFREVAQENAQYFADTRNFMTIVDAINLWLDNRKNGKIVCSDGISIISWEQSAILIKNILVNGNWLYF